MALSNESARLRRGHSAPCGDHAVTQYGKMDDGERRSARIGDGKALGWLSGLGIAVVPWVASGIVSTFLPDPETAFLWVLVAALVAMVGWIGYGIARIPGFRRGALLGSAISLGVIGLLAAILWWSQP